MKIGNPPCQFQRIPEDPTSAQEYPHTEHSVHYQSYSDLHSSNLGLCPQSDHPSASLPPGDPSQSSHGIQALSRLHRELFHHNTTLAKFCFPPSSLGKGHQAHSEVPCRQEGALGYPFPWIFGRAELSPVKAVAPAEPLSTVWCRGAQT